MAVGALATSGCTDSEPGPTQTLDVTGQTQTTITSTMLQPGDTVVDHGISAVVPDRGEGVQAFGDLAGGGAETLTVETAADGSVTITRDSPTSDADPTACHSPVACNDPAFNLEHHKWTTEFKWFFDAGSTPGANDRDNVEARLRSAVHNTSTGHNGCGISPNLTSSAHYQGRTNEAPNVTSSGGCGRRSGHNVVGFGALPVQPRVKLAVTCIWWNRSTQHLLEADTRINTRVQWYATDSIPNGCSNSFGIEPVMTHEFGHSFGLDHVTECQHGNLTMSRFINACNNSASTLGLGDIKGMQQMY